MGIINLSPNSFFRSAGNLTEALCLVEEMVEAGAMIIDIGGEATNPFVDLEKESPTVQIELDRVVPLVEAIAKRFDVLISVDTSQPAVMKEAVDQGANIINDQRALRVSNALDVVASLGVPVCLMHFFSPIRKPGSSELPELLTQIKSELSAATERCLKVGMSRDQIIIDPGFGQGNFGKNSEENFYLLSHLPALLELGFPLMVGWSRKSMIGEALGGVSSDKRLFGSVAADTIAAMLGASILRVHDVRETVEAVKIVRRLYSHS